MIETYNRLDKSRPFSPSKGNQTKYRIGNTWLKEDYLGYEAASEYLCSQILEYSNVQDFVRYTMATGTANEQNVHFCASEHFLQAGEQLITLHDAWESLYGVPFYKSMERLSTEERIRTTVDFMENQLKIMNAGEELTRLLEWDAFVLNEDRHSNNIAFIEDTDGNFRFAPMFDNGAAFLSDTHAYSLQENPHKLITKVKSKPFNVDFKKQVQVAESLYGKQLQLYPMDLENTFCDIRGQYGVLVANRIKVVCQHQFEKYADFFMEYQQEKGDDYEY